MNNLSFDPQTTWAFLIGNWEFKENSQLPNLPAVENNLTSLKEILIDPLILGIPKDQIISLKNQSDILQCFLSSFPKPVETLIVYYAGHGLCENTNLSLALPNSLHNDADTGLAFDKLWKKITNKATNIILILDCCFSGKAFNAITKQDGRNIVVLTATDKANLASSPKNWEKTAFTEHFIRTLKQGVRNHQPFLTLKDISNILKETLVQKSFPKPSENEFLDSSPFHCFHNLGFNPNIPFVEIEEVESKLLVIQNFTAKGLIHEIVAQQLQLKVMSTMLKL